MSYEERDTCMSYEAEDTCMSDEEEDTCIRPPGQDTRMGASQRKRMSAGEYEEIFYYD